MRSIDEWAFALFVLQCFGLVASFWALQYFSARLLRSYRRQEAQKQYNRGYIFAMQSLRAETYTAHQLLNMADGPSVTSFDQGIRDGVRSYQSYGELQLALHEATASVRNKE